MDPNAALAELLQLVAEYRDDEEELDFPMWALNIAEHIEHLHEWLSRGGALPSDWRDQQVSEHDADVVEFSRASHPTRSRRPC